MGKTGKAANTMARALRTFESLAEHVPTYKRIQVARTVVALNESIAELTQRPAFNPRLSKRERDFILTVNQTSDWCYTIKGMAENSGLPEVETRRLCRALARKGWMRQEWMYDEYDGLMRGSGYCVTYAAVREMEKISGKEKTPE